MELQKIQQMIYEVRGVKVMLDKDLAELYQVTTGNLNKAALTMCHSNKLPMSHLKNSSMGTPPEPTTKDCLGWNLSRNTPSPSLVVRRPLLTSIAMHCLLYSMIKSTSSSLSRQ